MNVSIIGATGYTGFELVKIISRHPYLELSYLTSDSAYGKKYSDIYPELRDIVDNKIVANDWEKISQKSDIVFLCLPHSASQEAVHFFYKKDKLVIDLSADFRIQDKKLYEETYNVEHSYFDLLDKAVYGIPEIYREDIVSSRLIANPGCYPISVLLPLYPLIKNKLIDTENIIADCKSGVSGAGKKLSEKTHFCEVSNDFKPYSIFSHRHSPEINFHLQKLNKDTDIIFTPHLLPVIRGIESTIYCKSNATEDDIRNTLSDFYSDSPFVRIMKKNEVPRLIGVTHTNFADIGIFKQNSTLILASCIDNLLKGASGNAVQNVNIIMNFPEETGLI